jgi:hypothetical protein
MTQLLIVGANDHARVACGREEWIIPRDALGWTHPQGKVCRCGIRITRHIANPYDRDALWVRH